MSQAQSFAAESPPTEDAQDLAQPQDLARPPASAIALGARHSPWVAAILAGFPGLGSIYNGSYARGVAFFLMATGTMHLAARGQGLWGFAVAFVWLFNVIDAYREARFIRAGLAQDLEMARPRPATSAAEGLGLGAVLFLIGLVSFLDLSLGIDVDWIFELWPLGLMAAGGWFLFTAIRRARSGRVPVAAVTDFGAGAPPRGTGVEPGSLPDIESALDTAPPPRPPDGW
jgi:hypothetical protein